MVDANGVAVYGGELVTEVAGLWVYGYVAKAVSETEIWVTYAYGEVDGEFAVPVTVRYDFVTDLIVCDPGTVFLN